MIRRRRLNDRDTPKVWSGRDGGSAERDGQNAAGGALTGRCIFSDQEVCLLTRVFKSDVRLHGGLEGSVQ